MPITRRSEQKERVRRRVVGGYRARPLISGRTEIESSGRSRRCLYAPSTQGATMLADFDLLLTAVFATADDLLPEGARNARLVRTRFCPDTRLDRGGDHVGSHGGWDGAGPGSHAGAPDGRPEGGREVRWS